MGLNFKRAIEFVGYHRPEYQRTMADMYYKKMEDDAMEPVTFNPPFEIKLGVDHGHTTDDGPQGWWKPTDDGNDEHVDELHFTKYKNGKSIEWRTVNKKHGGHSEKYDENNKITERIQYYPSQKIHRINFYNVGSSPDELTMIEYYPTGRVASETFNVDQNNDGDQVRLQYLDDNKKYISSKWIMNRAYGKTSGGKRSHGFSIYTKYRITYYAQTNNPIMIMTDDIHSGIKTTILYDREGNITDRKEEESNYVP
jgi:hypothetical protein